MGFSGLNANDPRIRMVVKTVDETIQSDIVISADSQVFLPLEANTRYAFCSMARTNGGSAEDMDITYLAPSGSDGAWNRYNQGASAETDFASEIMLIQNSNDRMWASYGFVGTGATAGNLSLAWAQTVSGAVDTTMRIGSYLMVFRL